MGEDVLQFDFNNCHAHWLRGHSLLYGLQRQSEALEEMRMAVDCARTQGKTAEAEQWEMELREQCDTDDGGIVELEQSEEVEDSEPPTESASIDAAMMEELSELRQQVAKMRRDSSDVECRHQAWHRDLCVELEATGTSLEEALSAERTAAASSHEPALLPLLGKLKTSASELTDRLQADRKWVDGEHQAFLDCSTEVLTLREMTAREFKERQDTSKQQTTDLDDLAKRVGELKPSVKVLRDRAKQKLLDRGQEDDEPDLALAARKALQFRALPASVKLRSFLDDPAVLRLTALSFVLGMLFMLGVFIEGFGRYRCRFVCSR